MKLKTFPLKTCLRYPGGKSKATKTLSPWYPENFKEYREPFIGGGSVAFYTTQAYPDIPIWINDLYVPLYNFWVQLRDNGEELSERLKEIKSKSSDFETQDKKDEAHKELFNQTRIDINNQDGLERAVSFFILNKCSFSGLTESKFLPLLHDDIFHELHNKFTNINTKPLTDNKASSKKMKRQTKMISIIRSSLQDQEKIKEI
jgi:hypothetical protein